MCRFAKKLPQFYDLCTDCKGATAIEYGLIAALIGLVIVISLDFVGTNLISIFEVIKEGLTGTERCLDVDSNCDK